MQFNYDKNITFGIKINIFNFYLIVYQNLL